MADTHLSDPGASIRITETDANSSHVDDLLRRQANLRGDTGITRDRGRRWYYQNWFILMIAGLIAAFGGWCIVEPIFDDFPYVEGTIGDVREINARADDPLIQLQVGSGRYFIFKGTHQKDASGKWVPVQHPDFKVGDRIGLYMERAEETAERDQEFGIVGNNRGVPTALFIIPGANTGATDDMKLSQRNHTLGSILLFPVVAGVVGLLIGAADGLLCRLPRRAFIAGSIGLIAGLVGGFIFMFIAGIVYSPISHWALKQSSGGVGGISMWGFLAQVGARGLGWALAGIAMGVGQGLALRSGRVLFYGFLGGLLGGLFGGFLFDPIAFFVSGENPSAHLSRLISLCVIGGSVGLMIGIVELLARDAWLRMVAGPLAGKEFLIFKNIMNIGASPKSDIYLFNDADVAPTHAVLRATGDLYEIESASTTQPLAVNNHVVQRSRLRHGDQIGLGRTVFVFQRKRG